MKKQATENTLLAGIAALSWQQGQRTQLQSPGLVILICAAPKLRCR
jgi:hypothetical protein